MAFSDLTNDEIAGLVRRSMAGNNGEEFLANLPADLDDATPPQMEAWGGVLQQAGTWLLTEAERRRNVSRSNAYAALSSQAGPVDQP